MLREMAKIIRQSNLEFNQNQMKEIQNQDLSIKLLKMY